MVAIQTTSFWTWSKKHVDYKACRSPDHSGRGGAAPSRKAPDPASERHEKTPEEVALLRVVLLLQLSGLDPDSCRRRGLFDPDPVWNRVRCCPCTLRYPKLTEREVARKHFVCFTFSSSLISLFDELNGALPPRKAGGRVMRLSM